MRGFEIFAVEPHVDMRAELERKGLKGVEVMEGGASSMRGVESQCVDAVVAAQVCSIRLLWGCRVSPKVQSVLLMHAGIFIGTH